MTGASFILFLISTNFGYHICPLEFPLLHIVCDGGHNCAKPFNESTIKESEPVKTVNVMDTLALGPVYDRLCFLRSVDILSQETMNPKKMTLSVKKEHFLRLT